MTTYQLHKAPDLETLNILIELGDLVAASDPIELQVIPSDDAATRASLLQAAASSILAIKAIRKARRLTEGAA